MAWTDIPLVSRLRQAILEALITDLRPLRARMASDQNLASASTVLQNISELVLTPATSTTYELTGEFVYNAGSTADIKFTFTFPAGASFDFFSVGLLVTAAADTELTSTLDVNMTSGTVKPYGGRGTGVSRLVKFSGTLTMGTTAGSLQVQAAQNTSVAEVEVVKAGSYMTLRKVG